MANTHPNSIFRWEDAASLEHACWQCPTKANSPRALQTCYGIHSMPCTSYHPTMHAIGAAHRCSGCVMTREMHDARHREIAELVAEYRNIDHAGQETPPRQIPLLERPPNLTAVQPRRERQADAVRYEITENDYLYNEHNPFATGDENDDDMIDIMSVTSSTPSSFATTETALDTPSKKLTKAEVRAQKKAKKSVKSQTKALKNQGRHLASVTSADVDVVARILHGDDTSVQGSTQEGLAHPLATDRTIEDVIARNLNFVKSIQAHKHYLFKSIAVGRKEVKERKRQKKRESRGGELSEDTVEMDEVVSAIMIKLGIAPSVVAASTTTVTSSSTSSMYSNSNSISTSVIPKHSHAAINNRTTTQSFVLRSTPQGHRRRAPSLTSTPYSATTSINNAKTGSNSASSSNKATTAIASKLRNAIKADLEKHENEVHMRYVRAGGFWRYVGKSVFERMTEIASELDVGTGERWDKKWVRGGKKDAEKEEGDDAEEVVVVGEEAMMLDE